MRINPMSSVNSQSKFKTRKGGQVKTISIPQDTKQDGVAFRGYKNALKLAGVYALVGGILASIILPGVALAFAAIAAWAGFSKGAKIDDSKSLLDDDVDI